MIKIQVTGVENAIAKIGSLVTSKTSASGDMRDIIYEGLIAGGEVLKEIAQAKCALAMDRGYATGKLMESIGVREITVSGMTGTCVVGTSGIIYAAHREYGGLIVANGKSGGNGINLSFQMLDGSWAHPHSVFHAPQPYMRPALDAGQSPVREAIWKAVGAESLLKGGF